MQGYERHKRKNPEIICVDGKCLKEARPKVEMGEV